MCRTKLLWSTVPKDSKGQCKIDWYRHTLECLSRYLHILNLLESTHSEHLRNSSVILIDCNGFTRWRPCKEI